MNIFNGTSVFELVRVPDHTIIFQVGHNDSFEEKIKSMCITVNIEVSELHSNKFVGESIEGGMG